MIGVALASDTDFDGWRTAARGLLAERIAPGEVVWTVGDGVLFEGLAKPALGAPAAAFRVPRRFLDLAKRAICHRDPERFALMYRLLFRLHAGEPATDGQSVTDAGVCLGVERVAKAVDRDHHKMTAFVRFRETAGDAGKSLFVAWFEPEHHIEELAAPFFVDRFAGMRWSILMPTAQRIFQDGDRAQLWRRAPSTAEAPDRDGAPECWWRTYYRSIFNPARLKVAGIMMPEMAAEILGATCRRPDIIPAPDTRRRQPRTR